MSTDQALPATILADDAVAETPFYIPATGTATRPRRTLKYGDTFAVVDTYGDIGASAGDADGLFHNDTRFLSHLELLVNGEQPLLLGSTLRDDNTLLSIDLTNPDFFVDGRIVLQKDLLHISRTIFLWRGRAYQRLAVRNHGDHSISLSLTLLFRSDFADLFEVRGLHRARRGSAVNRVTGADRALLSYVGLDGAFAHHHPDLRSAAQRARRRQGQLPPRAGAGRNAADFPDRRMQPAGRPAVRGVHQGIDLRPPRAARRHARCHHDRDVERAPERDSAPLRRRSRDAHHRHPRRSLPVRGHPLVLDDVRTGRADHRHADAVVRSQCRARRVAPPCRAPGKKHRSSCRRRAGEDPARNA